MATDGWFIRAIKARKAEARSHLVRIVKGDCTNCDGVGSFASPEEASDRMCAICLGLGWIWKKETRSA